LRVPRPPVALDGMEAAARQINVRLDGEHARKLAELAAERRSLTGSTIATFGSSPSTKAARSTKMPKMKRKPFSELSKEVRKRPGVADEIDARKRAIVSAVRLAELRQQIGQTQTELAQVLEMTQANVSRIEHTENLYLRTLADYVGALGGHIEVNAVFDDDVVPLGLVEKDRGSVAA